MATDNPDRDAIIKLAREIEPDFDKDIDGPGPYERSGDRQLTVAIEVISLGGGEDENRFSADDSLLWHRVGRFVAAQDDLGFWVLVETANVEEARKKIRALAGWGGQ